jgi:hypothetical protein
MREGRGTHFVIVSGNSKTRATRPLAGKFLQAGLGFGPKVHFHIRQSRAEDGHCQSFPLIMQKGKSSLQAASCPPFENHEGWGTHSCVEEEETKPKGWATRHPQSWLCRRDQRRATRQVTTLGVRRSCLNASGTLPLGCVRDGVRGSLRPRRRVGRFKRDQARCIR